MGDALSERGCLGGTSRLARLRWFLMNPECAGGRREGWLDVRTVKDQVKV